MPIGAVETGAASTVIGVIATIRDRHGHNDDGVITVPGAAGYHVILLVAALSSAMPAWRAARVDLLIALRAD